MRKIILIFVLLLLLSACATTTESVDTVTIDKSLRLQDGSYLFINENNSMRMVDRDGKPIKMKDGVEMELKDGTLILMYNKWLWQHIHPQTRLRVQ